MKNCRNFAPKVDQWLGAIFHNLEAFYKKINISGFFWEIFVLSGLCFPHKEFPLIVRSIITPAIGAQSNKGEIQIIFLTKNYNEKSKNTAVKTCHV